MCGNVICGRVDPAKPFFSSKGSFFSNSTTRLLASTTDADRQTRTRNRCNGEGYESVALVPLCADGETFGLIQFNDRRPGRFDVVPIQVLEEMAEIVATTVARKRSEGAVRRSEVRFRSLFENMLEGYAYCRILYDRGAPCDFEYLEVNAAFEALTGLRNVVGRKVSEVIPGVHRSNPELLEIYGGVAASGKPVKFETYVGSLGIWFSVSVYSPGRDHFIAVFENVSERRRAQAALSASEERYRVLFEHSRDSILTAEPPDWRYTAGNPAAVRMFGAKDLEEVTRHYPWTLAPERQPDGRASADVAREAIERALRDGYFFFDWTHRRITGEVFPTTVLLSRVEVAGRVMLQGTVRDVTGLRRAEAEKAALEQQLQRATKLEAIGRLAGGVAHDFNNLLSVILSGCSIIHDTLREGEPLRAEVQEIYEAGQRAAGLTRQLLAFGRRQVVEPRPLDLTVVLLDMEKMLRRLLGEDVELLLHVAPHPPALLADLGQCEQVVMNLVINARDAMPRGGKLIVEVAPVVCCRRRSRRPDRRGAGTVRDAGRDGHRHRHVEGRTGARLRAVLQHQGRTGHGPWARDGLRDREAERWMHRPRE